MRERLRGLRLAERFEFLWSLIERFPWVSALITTPVTIVWVSLRAWYENLSDTQMLTVQLAAAAAVAILIYVGIKAIEQLREFFADKKRKRKVRDQLISRYQKGQVIRAKQISAEGYPDWEKECKAWTNELCRYVKDNCSALDFIEVSSVITEGIGHFSYKVSSKHDDDLRFMTAHLNRLRGSIVALDGDLRGD
jgi:hypothetical protein